MKLFLILILAVLAVAHGAISTSFTPSTGLTQLKDHNLSKSTDNLTTRQSVPSGGALKTDSKRIQGVWNTIKTPSLFLLWYMLNVYYNIVNKKVL